MIDGILGIDVSKDKLDVSLSGGNKVRAGSFTNSSEGWRLLQDWVSCANVSPMPGPGQTRRFDDPDGISAVPQIATECWSAVSGASGHLQTKIPTSQSAVN